MTYFELQQWARNAPVNKYGVTFSPKDDRNTIKIEDDGKQLGLCRVHRDSVEMFRSIVFARSGVKVYDPKDRSGDFDWSSPTFVIGYNDQIDRSTANFVNEFVD